MSVLCIYGYGGNELMITFGVSSSQEYHEPVLSIRILLSDNLQRRQKLLLPARSTYNISKKKRKKNHIIN